MSNIISSTEEIIIFESPDGGKTVFSRHSGSSVKTLVKQDDSNNQVKKWYEWRDILKASEDNPALLNIIQQAELVYSLIKKERNE